MKVSVRFADINVVVPVGDGKGVFVRDLIDAAVVRYKKATNKVSDLIFGFWVCDTAAANEKA